MQQCFSTECAACRRLGLPHVWHVEFGNACIVVREMTLGEDWWSFGNIVASRNLCAAGSVAPSWHVHWAAWAVVSQRHVAAYSAHIVAWFHTGLSLQLHLKCAALSMHIHHGLHGCLWARATFASLLDLVHRWMLVYRLLYHPLFFALLCIIWGLCATCLHVELVLLGHSSMWLAVPKRHSWHAMS